MNSAIRPDKTLAQVFLYLPNVDFRKGFLGLSALVESELPLKAACLPKHPFPKAMGSINLMAYVIISKYADGLPLYRMANICPRGPYFW